MASNRKAQAPSNSLLVSQLRKVMTERQINARTLAERADVGPSFVYDILSGKSANPTTQKLSAIAEVLGVDVNYLMSDQHVEDQGMADTLIEIPLLAVRADSDGLHITEHHKVMEPQRFHRAWVKETLGKDPETLRTLVLSDDSMAPTLHQDDVVLVDTEDLSAKDDSIIVVLDGIGLAVRRLKHEGSDVHVLADNSAWQEEPRDAEDCSIIGRIIWSSHRF